MPKPKKPPVAVVKRDKSFRGVTEDIHNSFIAYCNRNGLNAGDTISAAMSEYMANHLAKK